MNGQHGKVCRRVGEKGMWLVGTDVSRPPFLWVYLKVNVEEEDADAIHRSLPFLAHFVGFGILFGVEGNFFIADTGNHRGDGAALDNDAAQKGL